MLVHTPTNILLQYGCMLHAVNVHQPRIDLESEAK